MDYISWIPERIARLRMEKGISARDMSLSLGQSESYINKIENKRAMPSMAGFLYICEFLEISPKDFFTVEVPSPKAVDALTKKLEKLPSPQLTHLSALVDDLLGEK